MSGQVLDRPGSVGETVQVRRRAAWQSALGRAVTAADSHPTPRLLAAYLAQRVAGADTTTGEAQ